MTEGDLRENSSTNRSGEDEDDYELDSLLESGTSKRAPIPFRQDEIVIRLDIRQ